MLCDTCVNAGTASYKYPCNCCDMIEGSSRCKYKKVRTHADRIRAMSDEELAEIIACPKGLFDRMDCFDDNRDCKHCALEWLQHPAE